VEREKKYTSLSVFCAKNALTGDLTKTASETDLWYTSAP